MDKAKYRYNVETKEWDIVLNPYNYGRLMQELEMLRQQVSRHIEQPAFIQPPRSLGPYEMPNPYKSPFWYGLAPQSEFGNSLSNCTGACMKYIVVNPTQNFC